MRLLHGNRPATGRIPLPLMGGVRGGVKTWKPSESMASPRSLLFHWASVSRRTPPTPDPSPRGGGEPPPTTLVADPLRSDGRTFQPHPPALHRHHAPDRL